MPSPQSEDLKTLYKGWVAALAANPVMELDQMRRMSTTGATSPPSPAASTMSR